jgi:hypothetical protein
LLLKQVKVGLSGRQTSLIDFSTTQKITLLTTLATALGMSYVAYNFGPKFYPIDKHNPYAVHNLHNIAIFIAHTESDPVTITKAFWGNKDWNAKNQTLFEQHVYPILQMFPLPTSEKKSDHLSAWLNLVAQIRNNLPEDIVLNQKDKYYLNKLKFYLDKCIYYSRSQSDRRDH